MHYSFEIHALRGIVYDNPDPGPQLEFHPSPSLSLSLFGIATASCGFDLYRPLVRILVVYAYNSGHTQATSKPVATRCPVHWRVRVGKKQQRGLVKGGGRGKKRTRVVMGTRTVPGSRRSRFRGCLPMWVSGAGAEETPPQGVRGRQVAGEKEG